jgi:hypothetical protein
MYLKLPVYAAFLDNFDGPDLSHGLGRHNRYNEIST